MYFLLTVGFSYFYTAITFEPDQQADKLRKQGGFIPGIRPGPPTEHYLARVVNRITLPGAIFLATLAVAPTLWAPPGPRRRSSSAEPACSSPSPWPSRR